MKRILDACCGSKMFWFDKDNKDVIFCDNREVEETLCDGRKLVVKPDVIADFTCLPFDSNTFYLAVFDPPHLKNIGEKSWLSRKYGKLPDDWPCTIKSGFQECMRVLKPNGILIFKWSETDITCKQILDVIEEKPLFGHKSGKAQKTHWMCFMKDGEQK